MQPTRFCFAALLLTTACLGPQDASPEAAWVTNPVDTPDGRLTLTYQVIDGRAVFQGDIDLGDAAEIETRALEKTLVNASDRRWPGAIIPYEIEPNHPLAQQIQGAMNQWQDATLFRFVPHTNQPDYVHIAYLPFSTVCHADLGRYGGEQFMSLAPGCTQGSILHELGHTIGLWHEQSRNDRDAYITVNYWNVLPGDESQFDKAGAAAEDDWPFDFGSIMLYGPYVAARDPSVPTMYLTGTAAQVWTPNTTTLSRYDVKGATLLAVPYSAPPIHLEMNASSKCLAAYPEYAVDNTGIYTESCSNPWTSEEWLPFALPGALHYKLINRYTGSCLTVGFGDGAPTRQTPCTSASNLQNFTVSIVNRLWRMWRNDYTALCLDDGGTALESPLVTRTCASRSSQMIYSY